METFGVIKSKILKQLTESYLSNNKSEIKEIINVLKTDKDFREVYLFYENMEHKYFDDNELAKLYVEEISTMLKNKKPLIEKTCVSLEKKLNNVIVENNTLYDALDKLLLPDNLKNIDNKITAKKRIIEIITTERKVNIKEDDNNFTKNEYLLFNVMTNSFNDYFDQILSEEEKEEFKEIINLSDEDLNLKVKELKEMLTSKIDNLMNEATDSTLKEKLTNVKNEVGSTDVSKYIYFKLKHLLTDLN